MREERRRRLEARGWRIGGAADFLGLSPDEELYVELKLRLAEGLKQRRVRRRLTQVELAKAMRSSQSRVAKMEAGDPTVSIDLLIRSLLAMGATPHDLGRLVSGKTTRTGESTTTPLVAELSGVVGAGSARDRRGRRNPSYVAG
jgi:DNA-binding XRE family transcriptional regulator